MNECRQLSAFVGQLNIVSSSSGETLKEEKEFSPTSIESEIDSRKQGQNKYTRDRKDWQNEEDHVIKQLKQLEDKNDHYMRELIEEPVKVQAVSHIPMLLDQNRDPFNKEEAGEDESEISLECEKLLGMDYDRIIKDMKGRMDHFIKNDKDNYGKAEGSYVGQWSKEKSESQRSVDLREQNNSLMQAILVSNDLIQNLENHFRKETSKYESEIQSLKAERDVHFQAATMANGRLEQLEEQLTKEKSDHDRHQIETSGSSSSGGSSGSLQAAGDQVKETSKQAGKKEIVSPEKDDREFSMKGLEARNKSHLQEVAVAHAQTHKIQAQMQEVNKTLVELQDKYTVEKNEWMSSMEKVKAERASSDQRVVEMEGRLFHLINQAGSEMRDLESRAELLKVERDESIQSAKATDAKFQQLKEDHWKLKLELEACQSTLQKQNNFHPQEDVNARDEVSQLQGQIEDMKKEKEKYEQEKTEWAVSMEKLRSEKDSGDQHLVEMEGRLFQLVNQVGNERRDWESAAESLKIERDESVQSAAATQVKFQQLKDDFENLKLEVESHKNAHNNSHPQEDVVSKEQWSKLQEEAKEAKTNYLKQQEKYEREKKEWAVSIKKLRSEKDSCEKGLVEMEGRLFQLVDQVGSERRELETRAELLMIERDESKQAATVAVRELGLLKEDLNQVKQELESSRENLETQNNSHLREISDANDRLNQVQKQMEEEKTNNMRLKEERANEKRKLASSIESLEVEKDSSIRDRRELESRAEALKIERDGFRQSAIATDAKLRQLQEDFKNMALELESSRKVQDTQSIVHSQNITELNTQLNKVQDELEKTKENFSREQEKHTREKHDWTTITESLRNEKDSCRKSLVEMEDRVQQFEHRAGNDRREWESCRDFLTMERDESVQAASATDAKLQKLEEDFQKVKLELESSQRALQTEQENHVQEITELNGRLSQAQENLEISTTDLLELQEKHALEQNEWRTSLKSLRAEKALLKWRMGRNSM